VSVQEITEESAGYIREEVVPGAATAVQQQQSGSSTDAVDEGPDYKDQARDSSRSAGGTSGAAATVPGAAAVAAAEGPDYKEQVQESVRGSAAAAATTVPGGAAAAAAAAGGREVDYKDQVRPREEEEEKVPEDDGKPAAVTAEAHWMVLPPPVVAEPADQVETPEGEEPSDVVGLGAYKVEDEEEEDLSGLSWYGKTVYRLKKDRRSQVVAVSVTVLVIGGIVVAGVCGSGKCSGGPSPSPQGPTTRAPTPSPTQFKIFTSAEQLQESMDLFLGSTGDPSQSLVAQEFGWPLGTWDVSRISDFARLFDTTRGQPAAAQFNENIDGWDMSRAVNLQAMFRGAISFNQPLASWDTSKVEDFSFMFNNATIFNHDVSEWDVSSATTMQEMFRRATSFNQDLCPWAGVVSPSVDVTNMFASSSCTVKDDPDLQQGPWCHAC
jgi:hypothetical protein